MRMTRSLSSWATKRGNTVLGWPLSVAVLMGAAGTPAIVAGQTAVSPAGTPALTASYPAAAVSTAPANGVGSAFELTFWQSVVGTDDPAAFDAYLVQYPTGTFSGLARARIAALKRTLPIQPVAQPAAAPAAPLMRAPAPMAAAVSAPEAAPAFAPTPAVLTTANAAPTSAEPSSAASSPASSPLSRLLAQLRGTGEAAAAAAAAPLVTQAPPAQIATSAPAPAPAMPVAGLAPAATPALAPAANYASARPVMLPVPDVAMPPYFCSIDARNAFHSAAYRPAVEVATRNNEAAVTYMRQLQQTYDRGQLGRDTAVLNAIAAEARAYQAEAARAYSAQAGLVRQFDALMGVPLRACTAGTQ